MTSDRLERLALIRSKRAAALDLAHGKLIDRLERELNRDGDVNISRVAELAGVTRATIYNTLARRQERRDELSGNGGAPAPAPADGDLEGDENTTTGEPT